MEIEKCDVTLDLRLGDCIDQMKSLPDNSVDAVVTDPPYEIGFMGKSWDNSGIANNIELWKECLRVLKPGGYLLSFAATRTYHRMAVAIEDAGFEIRDMIEWVYGSGFPKSHNIGKAVDKFQGNEREVTKIRTDGNKGGGANTYDDDSYVWDKPFEETKGQSEWEGWGTALKPAHEPICMARKPLSENTVAENCLKWKTGGINIDENRVGNEVLKEHKSGNIPNDRGQWGLKEDYVMPERQGRFPANLIHDNSEEVRECFPESKSGAMKQEVGAYDGKSNTGFLRGNSGTSNQHGGSGNASRYFKSIIYESKASKAERNKGCEGLEKKSNSGSYNFRTDCSLDGKPTQPKSNNHPTVKPIALMEYLIKMVTVDGGTVLDPFLGSGTTMLACQNTNRNGIGIEKEKDYFNLSKTRCENNVVTKKLF